MTINITKVADLERKIGDLQYTIEEQSVTIRSLTSRKERLENLTQWEIITKFLIDFTKGVPGVMIPLFFAMVCLAFVILIGWTAIDFGRFTGAESFRPVLQVQIQDFLHLGHSFPLIKVATQHLESSCKASLYFISFVTLVSWTSLSLENKLKHIV